MRVNLRRPVSVASESLRSRSLPRFPFAVRFFLASATSATDRRDALPQATQVSWPEQLDASHTWQAQLNGEIFILILVADSIGRCERCAQCSQGMAPEGSHCDQALRKCGSSSHPSRL